MSDETGGKPVLDFVDLGVRDYAEALSIQNDRMERRRVGAIPDTLLFVEHPPVYTMGRSGKDDNVLASPAVLEKMGVKIVRTGRGGDVTFHGPGQLVGYPILDLRARKMGVLSYVEDLERVLLLTLSGFGIQATTDRKNRGVWVGDEKIAALGVRVSRHITMHGFALNVAVDLSFYRHIVPCGIHDKGVTSMDRLVKGIQMATVRQRTLACFRSVFGYE